MNDVSIGISYYDNIKSKLKSFFTINKENKTDKSIDKRSSYVDSTWKSVSNSSSEGLYEYSTDFIRTISKLKSKKSAIIKRAKEVVTNYVVGTGIKPNITSDSDKDLKLENFIIDWAKSLDSDISQKLNLYGLQSKIMKSLFDCGAVIVKRDYLTDINKMNFAVQVLDIDYLATYYNDEKKGIINGIKRTNKRIVSCFLKKSTDIQAGDTKTLIEVPFKDICIVSTIEERPFFESVLTHLDDLENYILAQGKKQSISASFTGFVYTPKDLDVDLSDPSAKSVQDEIDLYHDIQVGRIEFLPQGKEIKFPENPKVDGYSEFINTGKRDISQGIGITYELLTGDYSQVNFSSSRMSNIAFKQNVDNWQSLILLPQFLDKLSVWIMEGAEFLGYNVKDIKINWTFPKFQANDETKEMQFLQMAVDSLQMSLSEAIRKQGKNPEDVFKEIAEERGKLKKLGILNSEIKEQN